MAEKRENVAVKIENDIEGLRIDTIRECNKLCREIDDFLGQMDTKMDNVFKRINDYPDQKAVKEIFPEFLTLGMRFTRQGKSGSAPSKIVATFWNQGTKSG